MQETANKQKRMTLKSVHQMLDGMSVELAEKVHLLFMAFFRFPPSPLSQEGLHLSLYSLSSGEGKIENFENPSFSKFWYRSRSLCPKGRAMRFLWDGYQPGSVQPRNRFLRWPALQLPLDRHALWCPSPIQGLFWVGWVPHVGDNKGYRLEVTG